MSSSDDGAVAVEARDRRDAAGDHRRRRRRRRTRRPTSTTSCACSARCGSPSSPSGAAGSPTRPRWPTTSPAPPPCCSATARPPTVEGSDSGRIRRIEGGARPDPRARPRRRRLRAGHPRPARALRGPSAARDSASVSPAPIVVEPARPCRPSFADRRGAPRHRRGDDRPASPTTSPRTIRLRGHDPREHRVRARPFGARCCAAGLLTLASGRAGTAGSRRSPRPVDRHGRRSGRRAPKPERSSSCGYDGLHTVKRRVTVRFRLRLASYAELRPPLVEDSSSSSTTVPTSCAVLIAATRRSTRAVTHWARG